jgi:two-component system sensor histidine kinase/response regulator
VPQAVPKLIAPKKHPREAERLAAVRHSGLFGTAPEPRFDDIAKLAAAICDTPIALIDFIGDEDVWIKARVGVDLDISSRDLSFCAHTILGDAVMEVCDPSRDERFRGNPFTEGPEGVHFYAGAPLITSDGLPLGALCVIDHKPRALNEDQKNALRALARQVIAHVELERRIAEGEASQRALRYIVDHAAEVIYNADASGRFTFVNATAEQIAGMDGEELVGRHFTDLVRADAREEVLAFYKQQLIDRVRHTYYEFPANFPDGREVWFGQNVQLIYDGERVTGFQAVARDVTEQRRIDEELTRARDAAIESARVKASFLANMSHEIRTPMNGIIGMAGLLSGTELTPDQREIAETIRSSAESLLGIINDILDFSKIEAGKLVFEEMEFDVLQAVEGAVDLVAEQARSKGIEIITIVDEIVTRTVKGDPGRLRQVLMNLIGNAVKFTERGEVVVRVTLASDDTDSALLRFEVRDTGIGISPKDRDSLFTPFVQGDNTSTRRYGGTGLGLAISKHLVELMGGEIGVESEPDRGSTFRFTARFTRVRALKSERLSLRDARVLVVDDNEVLRKALSQQLTSWNLRVEAVATADEAREPFDIVLADRQLPGLDTKLLLLRKPVKQSALFDALATRLGDARPRPRIATVERAMSHHRVLVAEDNPVNQKVAVRQLQKLGYTADTVANGLEAIEALTRIPYDLVLMDCQMPEMDGFSATRLIRAKGIREPRPIIVAMTANALEGDRDRCLAAGMDDYLSKPVRETELAAVLEKWVNSERSEEST